MPLHHNFKLLALGSNPTHVIYCSDALYNHCRVIKFRHFPLSSDNIPEGLCAPQQQLSLLGYVGYFLHRQHTQLGKKLCPFIHLESCAQSLLHRQVPGRTQLKLTQWLALKVCKLQAVFSRICVVHRLNLMSEKSFNQLGRTLWGTQGSWMIFGSQTATETCGTVIRWSEGSSW